MLHAITTFLIRNFFRNLSFSMITLGSLVVGITTSLLLFVWVKYEVTYDRTIVDHDRIFALLFHDDVEGEIHTGEGTRIPLMDFLSHEVPEVEAVTRIDNKNMVLESGEKTIHKTGVYGDSSFFIVHTPGQLQGNAARALNNNRSIAISQTLAKELFDGRDALGKTIFVDRKTEFVVTAVFAPYPYNSHFRYIHFVLPFMARPAGADDWVNYDVKLFDASSRQGVEKKIDRKIAQLYPDGNSASLLFGLNDWRLRWNFENGKVSGGQIVYVIIFSITGLFVLIMACVNYMNISTARAAKRMREIGVRKMTGATQHTLIRQFMIESLIISSVAALLSIMLAWLLLPLFNQLVGLQLVISIADPSLALGLLFIILVTSLIAGSYPAWILSSLSPAVVLKGSLYSGMGGAGLRKALVVFQFALSVVMIFCALITWQQTDFLLKKDLGYDKHRVINIWLDENLHPSFDELREQVLAHTGIESAAFGGASPMEVNGYAECNRTTAPFSSPLMFYGANIDENVLQALNFQFIAGRNFSSGLASDSLNFIITQKAAELLGFEDPVGKRITYNMFSQQEGEIIGVIKDFQHDDIHTSIKPVVFVFGKREYLANMFVRYRDGKLEEALSHLRHVFEQWQPGIPLNYSFLDKDFENQLYREKLLSNISIAFTIIAITIACLGLFGLVLFNAQRRTKEIGIRKVLGASVSQVTLMLCRDFIPPVFYAFLLAFPVAYYIMQQFLEGYASRIAISGYSFALVAGVMVLLVLITALYQSLKAARQNPVDSLKAE
jgi:putative ABC transport system permease protein